MRQIIYFSIIILGLLFLVGYFLFSGNMQNIDDNQKYIGHIDEITIANIGEYSIHNLIAKENGYFNKNNLDANIIEYPSGPPAVADLLAGKVDFAVAADFVGVMNIFTNKDLRILAELSKHEDFEVVARTDFGINDPTNLKGKKIGVTKKGVGEFFLGRFLTFNNLRLEDIEVIDLQPTEIVKQLENGQIDAAVVFNPHIYTLRKSLGNKLIIWPAQDNQKVFALLYTTNSFMAGHSDVVKRYILSLIESEKFIKNNNSQAKVILANTMNYEDPYVNFIWPKFDFSISLDQALLLSMEDQARFAIDNKLISNKKIPNYLDNIYYLSLQEIAPEKISIIH